MRGLFGAGRPAIAGLLGATGPAMAQPMQQPMQQPAQGMFRGPRKVNWGGVIADALAGAAGQPGQYLAGIQAQDAAAQQQQMRQQDRIDKREDWTFQQDYERAHPNPVNNDTVNDYNFLREKLGEDGATQYLRGIGDPIVTIPLPGGRVYSGPRSGMAAALQGGGAPTSGGVQAGHVEDGFRFKGGNPGDPNDWEPVAGGPTQPASGTFRQPVSTGPLSFQQFKRGIIGQESGGRYGVANMDGSGAMGIGQIMPATAQALSKRLGLPYRPELLGGSSAAARQYQDALTDAALQEAWQAGGSGKDPVTAAMYYHGGSNRRIWGPKTRLYGQQVLRRMRGS